MDNNFLSVSLIRHYFTHAANLEFKAAIITSENRLGRLDILPGHANMIAVIFNSLVIKTVDGATNVYFFTKGILEVSGNSVSLMLEEKID